MPTHKYKVQGNEVKMEIIILSGGHSIRGISYKIIVGGLGTQDRLGLACLLCLFILQIALLGGEAE